MNELKTFDISKIHDVYTIIELIRYKNVCTYMGSRCDCKFGILNKEHKKGFFNTSESNGCPELREIISIIEYIPQATWDKAINDRNKKHKEKAKGLEVKAKELFGM